MFRCKGPGQPYYCPDEQGRRQFHAKLRLIHDHHHDKFLQHYRYFRYIRPVAILFNIIILYMLFSWVGFKGIGIFFAAVIVIKEILHFLFFLRVERRIFKPMEKLKQGLDEVAKGNYDTKVEYDKPNDLGLLIASFNEMTEKLYEGEKMKAEYEENRNSLIANISHDLKTPMTAIQGYIEALLEGTVTHAEHRNKYLRTIHHNTVYVNKLIDDLFLFSKIDMQKLELRYEDVQIRAFMNDLMEEYRFDLAERKIRFLYVVRLEHDHRVSLDGKRFHQAFNNIISNAIQHGPVNDLSIQVELYEQDSFICISVNDNGAGIPEDKLPFIFDRFYRIDTERPKEFQSTGLGLAIAKELIEAHGGKISVSSVIGDTRFTIMLPILHGSEGESCR